MSFLGVFAALLLFLYYCVQVFSNMSCKLWLVRWYLLFCTEIKKIMVQEICKRRPRPLIASLSLLLFVIQQRLKSAPNLAPLSIFPKYKAFHFNFIFPCSRFLWRNFSAMNPTLFVRERLIKSRMACSTTGLSGQTAW